MSRACLQANDLMVVRAHLHCEPAIPGLAISEHEQ
jgi:hypothetical protein